VSGGNAQASVADPRVLEQLGLGCSVRNGFYGVLDWQHPARTVTGSLQLDNGPGAVADPRPTARLVIDLRLALQLLAEGWEVPAKALQPAIISPLSGCLHRHLTTLELAVLQGRPAMLEEETAEGRTATPLVLAVSSDKRWRERIGNGIPVMGAEAWGRSIGKAMALSVLGVEWSRSGGQRWVQPESAVH
jgi:site-specific DNA-cytosine methylase